MIVEQKILDMQLVRPCTEDNLKNSTCDLTIGEFYPMGEQSNEVVKGLNEVWIEPSSMLAVRTKEHVVLPETVTGIATLVTSLTHEGLLCLNVGVVDPGYDGHLSAFLVNFSRRPRKIALNDRLFRVLFFEHDQLTNCKPWINSKDDYHKFLNGKAQNEFATTFLDVDGITALAENSAWKVVLNAVLNRWIAPVSLFIAVISMIIAGISYFE
jgi:deoxycytidine triphosphate deaminase